MPNVPISISITDRGAQAYIEKLGSTLRGLGTSAAAGTASMKSQFMATFNQLNSQANAFKAASAQAFGNAATAAASSASSISRSYQTAFASIKNYATQTFQAMNSQANNTGKQIQNSFNSFNTGMQGNSKSVNQFLTALAGGAAITVLANGLKGLAAGAYEMSNAFFTAKNALTAVTGSSAEAERAMGFVQHEAMRLGQDVTVLATSYAKLTAAGKSSGLSLSQMNDVFSSLAETGTVLGFSAQQSEGAFRSLVQMLSKGKVQAEELRGQLGEHLPGAFEIAAKAMKVSTAELDNMLKKGQITAHELLTNLPSALREAYGRGLPEALQRSSVAFGRVKNEMMLFGRDVGQSMEPLFKSIANLGGALIGAVNTDSFKGMLADMSETLKGWIDKAAEAVKSLRYGFALVYGAIHKGWIDFTSNFQIAFIASVATVQNVLTKIGAAFDIMVSALKAVWNGAINYLKEGWASLLNMLSRTASFVGLDTMSEKLKVAADEITTGIVPAYDELQKKVAEVNANAQLTIDARDQAVIQGIQEINRNKDIQKQAIDATVESFRVERDALDAASSATDVYTAATNNASTAVSDLADNEKELKKIQEERNRAFVTLQQQGLQVFNQTRTAQEKYIQELDDLDAMLNAGVISQDTYNRAAAQARAEMEKLLKESGEMALTFGDYFKAGFEGINDSLSDVFFDPTSDNIKKMGDDFINTIRRMAAETLASKTLDALKGVFGLQTFDPNKQVGPVNTSPQSGAPNAIGAGTTVQQSLLDGALLSDLFKKGATEAKPILSQGIIDGGTSTGTVISEAMTQSNMGIFDTFMNAGSSLWTSITGAFSEGGGGLSQVFSEGFSGLGDILSSLMSSIGSAVSGSSGGGGGGGSGWGAVIGAVVSAFAQHGKVFEAGKVKAFATGGIVSGPTNFPMAGGKMGLMGEAGPEAIMPLQRDSKGNLGITGQSQAPQISIYNILDKSVILDAMASPEGGKVIVNQISKNQGAIKGLK